MQNLKTLSYATQTSYSACTIHSANRLAAFPSFPQFIEVLIPIVPSHKRA